MKTDPVRPKHIPIPEAEQLKYIVGVRLTWADVQQLDALAGEMNVSRSTACRRLMAEALEARAAEQGE